MKTLIQKLPHIAGRGDLESLSIAIDMIAGGVRPPVVEPFTSVPNEFLKSVWGEIHEKPSPKGQFPKKCYSQIRGKQQDVSIFLGILCSLGKRIRDIDIGGLLRGYRIYSMVTPSRRENQRLSLSECVYVFRDLVEYKIECRRCARCKVVYAHTIYAEHLHHCPFCKDNR